MTNTTIVLQSKTNRNFRLRHIQVDDKINVAIPHFISTIPTISTYKEQSLPCRVTISDITHVFFVTVRTNRLYLRAGHPHRPDNLEPRSTSISQSERIYHRSCYIGGFITIYYRMLVVLTWAARVLGENSVLLRPSYNFHCDLGVQPFLKGFWILLF